MLVVFCCLGGTGWGGGGAAAALDVEAGGAALDVDCAGGGAAEDGVGLSDGLLDGAAGVGWMTITCGTVAPAGWGEAWALVAKEGWMPNHSAKTATAPAAKNISSR